MRCRWILNGRTIFVLLVYVITSANPIASAASVVLSWQDNSSNEDGFKIERGLDNTSYTEIAGVGPDIQSYTDSGLAEGTTYCYRIRAYNTAGVSSPSNEPCFTIPNPPKSLTLTKSATGSGTVTSVPAGINCGSDCSEIYSSGTAVSLVATPAAGFTFAGWGGDADCLDGRVTMDTDKSCTATFSVQSVTTYQLTITVTSMISSEGRGSGLVASNPAGINCGSDCSEAYQPGAVISLTAVPAAGSLFAGWSGNADCLDGVVTMGANKSCTASFTLDTAVLNLIRSGDGTVTSNPSGINCGTECSKTYMKGTKVTLSAKAGANNKFAGWSGGGCQGAADCVVNLIESATVTAVFVGRERYAVGIYRPSRGEWFLDANGNGLWDGCNVDLCFGPFGNAADIPLVGDWTGTGFSNIGVFRPGTGEWFLDLNQNGRWDGCAIDRCLRSPRPPDTLPLVGDWKGLGRDSIGMVSGKDWYLDLNGDGNTENCKVDVCSRFLISKGDFPVSGDWAGSGRSQVGSFRPSTGEWFLDYNGDAAWKGCNNEICVNSFGAAGDRPIVGDWTGNGTTKIGIYRPLTGEWFLDLDGDRKWDSCGTDACIRFLEPQNGDLPVAGKW